MLKNSGISELLYLRPLSIRMQSVSFLLVLIWILVLQQMSLLYKCTVSFILTTLSLSILNLSSLQSLNAFLVWWVLCTYPFFQHCYCCSFLLFSFSSSFFWEFYMPLVCSVEGLSAVSMFHLSFFLVHSIGRVRPEIFYFSMISMLPGLLRSVNFYILFCCLLFHQLVP